MAAKDHTANDRAYDERANEEKEEKKRKGSKPLEQKGVWGYRVAIQTLSECADSARPPKASLSCVNIRKKEKIQKEGKERRFAENGSNDVRGKTQGRES